MPIIFFNVRRYDTTLYCCLENITSKNKSWLKANRLALNVNKTKYMLFSKRKNNHPSEINVKINNNDIQSVTEFNFLGLLFQLKIKLGYTC